MKLLLLCLGLSLVCAQQDGDHDRVRNYFNMEKISGEWYPVLLASNVMESIEKNGAFRMFVYYIQVLDPSSLEFTYYKKINGECTELSYSAKETDVTGIYRVSYDKYTTFHLVETVYSEYLVLHTQHMSKNGVTQVMTLLGRTPDLSQEIKERFQKLCHRIDIPDENILDLTKVDRCLQAQGSR